MHWEILISVVIISLLSLIGAVTLSIKEKFLRKIMRFLVAFAAGTMLGAAFFDLFPEAVHELGNTAFAYILGGIIGFFIIERYVFWHHCHNHAHHKHHVKPYTYLNLVGDGVHNFIDGAIIAAAYLTNTGLGIITTIAIALHEIPQEIGDFAILVNGGLKVRKALLFNFLTAVMAIIGAGVTYVLAPFVETLLPFLIAVAGGGFLYIATTDLFPELHGEDDFKKLTLQTALLILGILVIFWLNGIIPSGVH